MARLDWDRETREAKKRRSGSIPVWADPSALGFADEQHVKRALEPLRELVREFRGMSKTQRRQRANETEFQLRKLRQEGERQLSASSAHDAVLSFARAADILIEEVRSQR